MKNNLKLMSIILLSLLLCLLTGCLGVFIQDSLLDADKQIELFVENKNVYYSIHGTGYRDDPDTFVYSLESLWLKDNKLEEETLAYKICKESKEEGIVITYKDAQGNELTESYVFLVQKFSMA